MFEKIQLLETRSNFEETETSINFLAKAIHSYLKILKVVITLGHLFFKEIPIPESVRSSIQAFISFYTSTDF